MNDLISRAEAIELKPEFLNPNVNRETKEQTAIDRAYARGWNSCNTHWIKEIIEDLPSTQPEQRWIPCSERLPEEKDAGILKKLGTSKRSEYVLATVEVKGERMTVTACTYDGEWHWDKKYTFPDYKIVAWMPLPEPYEKDDEEK